MRQLVNELIEYPAGRSSDCVMALWFAWKRARDASPRYASFNRLAPEGKRTPSIFHGTGRAVKNPAYL